MRPSIILSILTLGHSLGLVVKAEQPIPARPAPADMTFAQAPLSLPAARVGRSVSGIPSQPQRRLPESSLSRPSTIADQGIRAPSVDRAPLFPHPNALGSGPATPSSDAPVRRAQAGPTDLPALPATSPPASSPAPIDGGGASLSLQAALYGALTGNPDLVALRSSSIASPESVEVARRFPTTLNPTLWVDVRPFVSERSGRANPDHKDALYYFSWRQPIELGHQTTHRHAIAKAAYNQQQWTVVQAELLALVQTYRFFQTAAYRREKLRVANELADFNDRLLQSLRHRLEANQVQAVDVALAEVENQATRQQVEVARQDYTNALTDLRNQIGIPETAGTAEPLGEFILPPSIPEVEDRAMIQLALQSRPEIHAAQAQVAGTCSAVKLARADRIPTPVVGPVYERDEQGTQFLGFVYITSIPVINNGKPLVIQREADYRRAMVALQQVQRRTVSQVKAAVAKWNSANRLVGRTRGLTDSLKAQVASIEHLFEAGQADLTKLLQARQRLIQLENAHLDATWQATQAQADLLTALGAPTLIGALQNREMPTTSPPPPVSPAMRSSFRQ
jgi:cobalt-zinc-cadmium efflux system outer membrane protein